MTHADARGIKVIEAPRDARGVIVVGRSCPISPRSSLDTQTTPRVDYPFRF